MAKLSFVITVALAAVVISGVAVAQEKPGLDGDPVKHSRHHQKPGLDGDPVKRSWHHRGHDRETPTPEALLERMTRHLDLNEMQQQSISELMGAAKTEFDSLHERSLTHRKAIRGLDTNDENYGRNLQRLAVESGKLAEELILLTGRIRGDINTILTPEQQQKQPII